MKKYWLGLMAIVMGLFISSCNSKDANEKEDSKDTADLVEKVKDLVDAVKNMESAEDAVNLMKEAAQLNIDFYKSEPSADDVKAFEKAGRGFVEAIQKLDGEKQEVFSEAMKMLRDDEDFMKLSKEADDAEKTWKESQKDKKSEDEE